MRLVIAIRIDRKRPPDINRSCARFESLTFGVFRCHADNFIRIFVKPDDFTDNLRISSQSVPPEFVAEDYNATAMRLLLFGREAPALRDRKTEKPKIILSHEERVGFVRAVDTSQLKRASPISGTVLENALFFPPHVNFAS